MLLDVRTELIELRRALDANECDWLRLLGEFDADEYWRDDGFRSPVPWLESHCGLSRVAASERVRIARQLRRRPVLAGAAPALSYSQLRAVTRMKSVDDDADRVLVEFARSNRATDVEQLVAEWRKEAEERDPTITRFDAAGVAASTTFDGMGVTELVTSKEEHDELLAIIDANVERRWHLERQQTVPAGTPDPDDPTDDPHDPADDDAGDTVVEPADADDPCETVPAGTLLPPPGLRSRRAEALIELIRVGHAHIDHPEDSTGDDRYTLHLGATLADLTGHRCEQPLLHLHEPTGIDTALRLACDCAIVSHVFSSTGELLDLGRKTRVWNRAQRRAIRRRDRNRCRFPGCINRIHDVHHVRHWTRGGRTAVDNGCLLCTHHHKLVHEGGWTLTGNAERTLTFTSRAGVVWHSPVPTKVPRLPAAAAAIA